MLWFHLFYATVCVAYGMWLTSGPDALRGLIMAFLGGFLAGICMNQIERKKND